MSAIVPVNQSYRIELDKFSWAIAQHRPRNKGNRKPWEQISWHRTLQQAGNALAILLVDQDNLEGVDEVINALAASSRLVAAAIKESPYPDSWAEANQFAQQTGADHA